MDCITAPQADLMIHCSTSLPNALDDKTKEFVMLLFQKIQAVNICGDYERRELWITAERGTIEDFGDYDDYLADGDVESREEFEELWLSEYPEPQEWYKLATMIYENAYFVFLNGKLILQISLEESAEYALDRSKLVKWLLSAAEGCINMLKDGTYNAYVDANLPYRKRIGKILREDFWRIFSGEKEAYLQDISREEIQRFGELINEQPLSSPTTRLPEMSAGLFFDCCQSGYGANHYYGIDTLSPKELYQAHADRRDDGLLGLNEDSADEFSEWYHDKTIRAVTHGRFAAAVILHIFPCMSIVTSAVGG